MFYTFYLHIVKVVVQPWWHDTMHPNKLWAQQDHFILGRFGDGWVRNITKNDKKWTQTHLTKHVGSLLNTREKHVLLLEKVKDKYEWCNQCTMGLLTHFKKTQMDVWHVHSLDMCVCKIGLTDGLCEFKYIILKLLEWTEKRNTRTWRRKL